MAEAEQKAPPAPKPQTWWQWLVVYPALATAVMGAVPTAWQHFRAWQLDTTYAKVEQAVEQQKLWERNIDCLDAKPVYTVDVSGEVTVGVTLCGSGDALLRYAVDETITYTWVRYPGYPPGAVQTRWDPHEMVPDVDAPRTTNVRVVWGTKRCIRVRQGRVRQLVTKDGHTCAWEETRLGTGALVAQVKTACTVPCPD